MAKNNQAPAQKPELNPVDVLFEGVDTAKADAIRAHFDNVLSGERAAMQELLDSEQKAVVAKADFSGYVRDMTPNAIVETAARMHDGMSDFIVTAETHAVAAAKSADMQAHTTMHGLALAFTEFRNALSPFLPD